LSGPVSPTPSDPAATGTVRCVRHPNVETGLSCGRCGTPICPKCMVMTDVGGRCPDCAPRRRLPQFEVKPLFLLRGIGAAIAAGAVLGLAWGLLLPGDYGFFTIILGAGVGYGVGESVSLATNRKLAPVLQITAAFGVLLAFAIRNIFWASAVLVVDDLFGYIALVVGIIVAMGRLRF
jgi:hypothetical protein